MSVKQQRFSAILTSIILVMILSSCSNWSKRDRNTVIGAGVGAVGGAVLSSGSGLGTVGGAAIGGVIGHQINK